MRRILVEHARRKQRLRRGGDWQRVELGESDWLSPPLPDDVLALDEALAKLEARDPRKGTLVKLRYFSGLTLEQAAETLGISSTTAKDWWAYARAWLHREIGSGQ
jgi:RNA polymerase sigma factor (TIGR02999 family)